MSSDSELDEVDKHFENRLKVSKENRYAEDYSEEDSEDNVMNISDADTSDEEYEDFSSNKKSDTVDDENYESWGGKEGNYGGDDVDDINNAAEADELVRESMRIQKKHIGELNVDDYMDNDLLSEWKEEVDTIENKSLKRQGDRYAHKNIAEKIGSLQDNEKEDYIKLSFPEFYPLCQEFSKLNSEEFNKLKHDYEKSESNVSKVKFFALSTYLGSILNYLNLLIWTIKNEDSAESLKDHPIMESILSSREAWRQASELVEPIYNENDENTAVSGSNKSLDNTEEQEHDFEKENESDDDEDELSQDHSDNSQAHEQTDNNSKYNINPLMLKSREVKKRSVESKSDIFEGDLENIDKDEKKQRKKSLRFYTSKIDQQAIKKDSRLGGDEDLPYQERLYERQQRLIEEARKRGLDTSDKFTNLGNDDDDDKDIAGANDGNDFNEYYNSVKFARENKKFSRKQAHNVAVKAFKEGKLADFMADESIATDGKRAINYQIMKNKGLTAKRKKEAQNSRVKKRKKYDQAKKKLKSIRQVYTGQQGSYGGEATGIKKNLSKSIKLK